MRIRVKSYAFLSLLLSSFALAQGFAQTSDGTQDQGAATDQQAANPNLQADLTASALAAQNWLKLVDDGQYDESWSQGSSIFQLTIQQDEWKQILDAMRKPLGSVISRKVVDQRTATNPKGLPAGDYMVMVYDTSFSGKSSAHELVTLVKGDDGQWRVLTYQVG